MPYHTNSEGIRICNKCERRLIGEVWHGPPCRCKEHVAADLIRLGQILHGKPNDPFYRDDPDDNVQLLDINASRVSVTMKEALRLAHSPPAGNPRIEVLQREAKNALIRRAFTEPTSID